MSRGVGGGATSVLRTSLAVRGSSIVALVVCAQIQQAFDTSPTLLSYSLDPQNRHGLISSRVPKLFLAFVRWDTVYFLSLASPGDVGQHVGGYDVEQSLAFQPGIVYLLRWTGYVTPRLDGEWSPTCAILLTTLLANMASLISPLLLYQLTRRLTRNDAFAYTSVVLSILAPAAGTVLTCPTPEPFFSLATLAGLLALQHGSRPSLWPLTKAAMWFSVATMFRANGVLSVGFLAWQIFFSPATSPIGTQALAGLATFLPLALVTISPFVLFQVWAYARLCQDAAGPAPWCKAVLPNVYSHVQSTYWNVGLFRYWEWAQVPNFALASPILLLLGYGVYRYFSSSTLGQIAQALRPFPSQKHKALPYSDTPLTLQSMPLLTPFVVHSAVMGMVLLLASHVQIALRFASPGGLPFVWWSAAALAHSSPATRRMLTTYLASQYVVSIVLYAGFYPPA